MMAGEEPIRPLDPDTVRQGVRSLPSWPAVVIELLHAIDDDQADIRSLVRELACDQALATKILRVANSSFYGVQGKVHTVGDAFVILGLEGVRRLAVATAMKECSRHPALSQTAHWNFAAFWKHSLAAGLAAEEVAKLGQGNASHAFAAGLLHDIGRLALVNCFPQHWAAVVREQGTTTASGLSVERQVLGMDHAAIGQLLAEHWHFPTLLSEAIGAHHVTAWNGSGLAPLTRVADVVAHAVVQSAPCDQDPGFSSSCGEAWPSCSLDDAEWRKVADGVSSRLEATCAAFAT